MPDGGAALGTSIAAPHFFMLELLLALDDRSP